MRWQIECTVPATSEQVVGLLESARDAWVRETPQETHDEVDEMEEAVMSAHNEAREKVAKMRRDAIAAKNALGLDETHAAVVRQMNDGIEAAHSIMSGMPAGTHARVTIAGQYDPGNSAYLDEMVDVRVNTARPPTTG